MNQTQDTISHLIMNQNGKISIHLTSQLQMNHITMQIITQTMMIMMLLGFILVDMLGCQNMTIITSMSMNMKHTMMTIIQSMKNTIKVTTKSLITSILNHTLIVSILNMAKHMKLRPRVNMLVQNMLTFSQEYHTLKMIDLKSQMKKLRNTMLSLLKKRQQERLKEGNKRDKKDNQDLNLYMARLTSLNTKIVKNQ